MGFIWKIFGAFSAVVGVILTNPPEVVVGNLYKWMSFFGFHPFNWMASKNVSLTISAGLIITGVYLFFYRFFNGRIMGWLKPKRETKKLEESESPPLPPQRTLTRKETVIRDYLSWLLECENSKGGTSDPSLMGSPVSKYSGWVEVQDLLIQIEQEGFIKSSNLVPVYDSWALIYITDKGKGKLKELNDAH